MKTIFAVAVSAFLASTAQAQASDPADVEAVVAATKASSPDFRTLCQSGPDNIRKLVGEKTRELAMAGKLKGNPKAAGEEAGQKLGQECRG